MKNLKLLLLYALLLCGAQAYAQDDVILTSSSPFGTGTFVYNGDVDGKPSYKGPKYSIYDFYLKWSSANSQWVVYGDYSGFVFVSLFSNSLDTPLPPDVGWEKGGPIGTSNTDQPLPVFSGGVTVYTDDTAPAIVTLSPVDGAVDVPFDQEFSIEFSETIKAGSGNITIHKSNGDIYQEIMVTSSAQVTISGNTLSFATYGLASDDDFYVTVDDGAVLDLFNNSFGLSDNTVWNFDSEEVSVTVTGAGDADFNGTYFGNGILSNALYYTKGDYRIRYKSTGGGYSVFGWVIESTVDDTKGSYISLDNLTILKPNDIGYVPSPISSGYAATSPAPTLSGNVKTPALSVIISYPSNGMEGFPITNDLELHFNKDIQLGTGEIGLYDKSTYTLIEAYDVETSPLLTVSGNTLIINPTADLEDEKSYYLLADNTAIEDLSGTAWGGIPYWYASNAIGFEAAQGDITISGSGWNDFNLALKQTNTSDGKGYYANGDYSVTLSWDDDISPERWILNLSGLPRTVTYVNYSDTPKPPDSGWEAEGVSEIVNPTVPAMEPVPTVSGDVSEYVAPDVTPPGIVTFSPKNGEGYVRSGTDFIIEFDEAIAIGTGNFNIYQQDGTLLEAIDITGSQVTVDGESLTVEPSEYFGNKQNYYMLIDAGAVQDLKGNDFVGITSDDQWRFWSMPLLEVVNAGSAEVNGYYEFVGYESSRPLFGKQGASGVFGNGIQWWPEDEGGNWILSINNNNQYISNKDSLVASTHDWAPNSNAENPGVSPTPELIYPDLMEFERPTYTMTTTESSPTYKTSIEVSVVFSEAVRNFKISSLSISNGSAANLKGDGINFTFDLIASDEGAIEVDLVGSVLDSIGNSTTNQSGTDFEIVYEPVVMWDGMSWSNGDGPSATDNVLISGDLTVQSDLTINKLTIASGVALTVDNEATLTINGDVINNGSFTIASGASLMTQDYASIPDNIIIKRNSRYADGKYSFVGSPVTENPAMTGSDLGPIVYSYDETTPYGSDGLARWENAYNDQLISGKGYAQAGQQELVFVGKPNAGTITYTGTYTEDTEDANEGWNLVANPYPSAINIRNFIAENSRAMNGAVYIWDDNGSDLNRGSNSDYIVANGVAATSNSAAGNSSRYNLHLGTSQGFFVKLFRGSTNVVFTESQRVDSNNADDHFFRKTSEFEIVRLNLTSEDGLFKQTVVAWSDEVDDEVINNMYDAPVFNPQADYLVYTQKLKKALAIQTISREKNEIEVGMNLAKEGNYVLSLEIDDYSGALYLMDRKTGEVIDLESESYTFYSESGQFTDRFKLLTKYTVLHSQKLETSIYVYDGVLYLNEIPKGEKVNIYDLSGQLVDEIQLGNSRNYPLDLSRGVYVLKTGKQTLKFIIE